MKIAPGTRNDRNVDLHVGATQVERVVSEAERLLLAYRADSGSEYLDYEPRTLADEVVPEDLAVTTLINSRFGMAAFRSMAKHGQEVQLARLPTVPLEKTTEEERETVARTIAQVAAWPGFGASTATKVLHKKRPALIPILDNQAIFGAYMYGGWPDTPSLTETVKKQSRVREALDWIAYDLTRIENQEAWLRLHEIEPRRTRIQIFDSIWWMHFREEEPVPTARAVAAATATALPSATEVFTATAEVPHLDHGTVPFYRDEGGYQAWLEAHPSGFVLNSYPKPKASYLKLHRASCSRIRGVPPRGSTWTDPYMKVCGESREAIEVWATQETGGELSPCKFCRP